tara:strand:+ start:217 stop:507 length:291 start_codon:yes stop_codon:yes gene_type:complete
MNITSVFLENDAFPELYGFIAAALTTIAFLPQVITTIRRKSADDISIFMLILFISGLLFWILYGFRIESFPIILANIITFLLNFLILILKIIFKNS